MACDRQSLRASLMRGQWRATAATFSLIVYVFLAMYFVFQIVVPWATSGLGEPWTFGPILG